MESLGCGGAGAWGGGGSVGAGDNTVSGVGMALLAVEMVVLVVVAAVCWWRKRLLPRNAAAWITIALGVSPCASRLWEKFQSAQEVVKQAVLPLGGAI